MPTSKESITEILIILAASYPRFNLTKDTITAYVAMLKDVEPEALKAAAFYCASNSSFFPSVFELRQAVAEINRKAEKIPNAYEAWEDLITAGSGKWAHAIEGEDGRFYIDYGEYQFIHPLVGKVAKMLGWPRMFPGEDNPSTDRAHFFKAYEQAVSEYLASERMLPDVQAYISSRHMTKKLEG